VRGLSGRQVPQARQMLQRLLVDRPTLTPFAHEGGRGYRIAGLGTYGALFAGEAAPPTLVSPAGFATPCGLPMRGIVRRRRHGG
jgi:hypothetical protein